MNREYLKGLGLEDDVIDKVMAEHGKTVNKTKGDLEAVTTERDNLKQTVTDRDTQLDNLGKKVKDNDELTAEIDRLKGENKTATQELQDKLDKQAFDFSLEKSLSAAKVRNPKAVKALLDTDSIKLDGETLLGLDDQLKAIKESDGYLFEEEDQQQQGTPKPKFLSGQHKTGTELSADDFSKMTYLEKVKLKKDDPATYDSLVGK